MTDHVRVVAIRTSSVVLAAFLLGGPPAIAQEPDASGCVDAPLINRMPGCRIYSCKPRDFDEVHVRLGASLDGTERTKPAEGRIEEVTYECPSTLSSLQITRNFKNAFAGQGFDVLFDGDGSVGGYYQDSKLLTLNKNGQYVEVYAYAWHSNTFYEQRIVTPKNMKQDLAVNAAQIEADIRKTNQATLYGIEFDFNQASLRPESKAVLEEVAVALRNNSSWKIRVEGHTDSVGKKTQNQKLSLARASTVVQWLVGKGIASDRLTSAGLGDSKPVASNSTNEGRAKNRRVVLTKL